LVVETERKIYTTVVIVALVGLLFSCVAGALAGGVAGFLVGQRQGRIAAEQAVSGAVQVMPRFRQLPGFGATPSGVEGALIVDVVSGTPASEAGLQAGDVIVAIDRTPVDGNHPLGDVIGQYQPGDRVTVQYWRGEQQESVTVRLTQNPEVAGTPYLGVYFEMQNSSQPGD
jgi:predicted metalloprotease with PDZ domain